MNSTTKHPIRRGFSLGGLAARGLLAATLAGMIASACDVHGISAPGATVRIVVTPNATLTAGGIQQMVAVAYDADGRVTPITPTWSVAASGGAINAAGSFTAGTVPGLFANTVVATLGSISGSASITVTPGALATITVTPNPVSMVIGTTQQFTAAGQDASGNAVTFTPTWSVVAGGGAVNASGLFTAGTVAGTFTNTIQASSLGIKGTATVTETAGPLAAITVTPNPVTLNVSVSQQFTAAGADASGNVVAIAPVWSVVSAAAGTIGSGGLFTAGTTPGTYTNTVKATSGAISGTATVTVTSGGLATITVTPNPASVAINGTQQFTAVGKDAGGNTVAITPTWAVVGGGGTIGIATGLFTAGTTTGTYTSTVRASIGSVAGFATVTVTSAVLASITVSPNPVFMQANGAQQFTAVGNDANGNVVVISPTWSVVTAASGTIGTGGLFTAGTTPGTYANTVKATSGTISGTATVTVTAGALATITVSPNPASVLITADQQFSAVGRDGSGNVIPIAPVWAVVNGGGIINPNTGLFTAGGVTGTFTNTVQASSGAISGAATVTVTSTPPPAPIANLGTAALNGIMAGTAITCSTNGLINANISISPGITVTGFPPCQITGVQHLGDATAAQNQIDLTAAYNTLAGLACAPANAISANLGGTTKAAGVYCTASGIGVTGTLTLDGGGDPNANFVFQAGSSLTTAGSIVLINGAQAKNVWWQVGSSATLGTASAWQGNIVSLTSITLNDNATMLGRALARNGAVSLGANNVITLP